MTKSLEKQNQYVPSIIQSILNPNSTYPPVVSTKVNAVQYLNYSGMKNKGRNKSKKSKNQQEGDKTKKQMLNIKIREG